VFVHVLCSEVCDLGSECVDDRMNVANEIQHEMKLSRAEIEIIRYMNETA